MLSFGGAVPGVGVGFAMLDLFREIDIPAYEAHIEPNMPLPSDQNFADFFATALGIGPDQYETGGLTKPCLLYTSPSPRDGLLSRMPSSA